MYTGYMFSQVEPNTKLFPAVFSLPSSQNMLQLELGKLKVSFVHCLVAFLLNYIRHFLRAMSHSVSLYPVEHHASISSHVP